MGEFSGFLKSANLISDTVILQTLVTWQVDEILLAYLAPYWSWLASDEQEGISLSHRAPRDLKACNPDAQLEYCSENGQKKSLLDSFIFALKF